jgi:hypothetical protein
VFGRVVDVVTVNAGYDYLVRDTPEYDPND